MLQPFKKENVTTPKSDFPWYAASSLPQDNKKKKKKTSQCCIDLNHIFKAAESDFRNKIIVLILLEEVCKRRFTNSLV